MKLSILGIIFSLILSAAAKPGEPYILTGREKSIFAIFQADLKAYPELYADEDINSYYEAFKTLNNLGERKLKLGEELRFPDTALSKKIREAEAAEAARAAEEAAEEAAAAKAALEAAEARARAKENPEATPAAPPETESSGEITLFGSDKRSAFRQNSPKTATVRTEAELGEDRHEAIHYFQHTMLPFYLYDHNRSIVEDIENNDIKTLTEQAQEKVDERFAKALVLHAYPEKKTYVLQFEKPAKAGEYFFFAIKREESGRLGFFSLEQGISFFGTGNVSTLHEWLSGRDFSDLGGRDYKDLPSFLKELASGPAKASDADIAGQ